MKRNRLIPIGAFALILTIGTGQAFGAMLETNGTVQENKTQLVTQVTKDVVISGPVRTQTPPLTAVLKSQAPEIGSIDWMAQQKEETDRLKLEAEQTKAELEAEVDRLEAELEAEINRQAQIKENTEKLNETMELLKAQVGVTRYAHGGSNLRYWDCSGLVRWAYARLGVDLRHSATTQRDSGTIVSEPIVGDLVSFNHKGWRGAYHIGIYLGPDQMIHSGGKPGDRTEIRSISDWAKVNGNSEVVYTRIVETNN
jgi:cell wall-associated NlpC family hydrolase